MKVILDWDDGWPVFSAEPVTPTNEQEALDYKMAYIVDVSDVTYARWQAAIAAYTEVQAEMRALSSFGEPHGHRQDRHTDANDAAQ